MVETTKKENQEEEKKDEINAPLTYWESRRQRRKKRDRKAEAKGFEEQIDGY